MTTSNTPVSTTTSFDLIENNQPKRAIISSMSTASISVDGQTATAKPKDEQAQNHQKFGNTENGTCSGRSSRGSISLNEDKKSLQSNESPGYDKMSDIIIDPMTIASIESKPVQTASSASPIAQLSAKSSPTTSS
jgi:hypothetical protein